MNESPVLVQRREGYRVITLNRPQRLNAFDEAMHRALRDALAEAESDPACRALLLTGAGRGFCAGQDLGDRLSAAGETSVLGGALEAYYNPLIRKLRALPLPIVAAVNGVAAGAGANIALACDIVLAARSATFVLRQDRPHPRLRGHVAVAAAGRSRPRPRACADRRATSRRQGRSLGPHLENARRPRADGASPPALRPLHRGADGGACPDQARPR